eukprot:TRINITY_DN2182_c0_g1_i1.p1 TRINITY_DN2182_c0_g1~~TRINITY_DN2182_c0_g1_i1.p1  ORF type:complete len:1165 (+),score=363.74 TRINITY_DN2182_c0_g1_i1:76-3495(+)
MQPPPGAGGAELATLQTEVAATLRRRISTPGDAVEVFHSLRRIRLFLRDVQDAADKCDLGVDAIVQALLTQVAPAAALDNQGGAGAVPMHQAKVLDRSCRPVQLDKDRAKDPKWILKQLNENLPELLAALQLTRELLRIKIEDAADVGTARAFADRAEQLHRALRAAPGGVGAGWMRLAAGASAAPAPPEAGEPGGGEGADGLRPEDLEELGDTRTPFQERRGALARLLHTARTAGAGGDEAGAARAALRQAAGGGALGRALCAQLADRRSQIARAACQCAAGVAFALPPAEWAAEAGRIVGALLLRAHGAVTTVSAFARTALLFLAAARLLSHSAVGALCDCVAQQRRLPPQRAVAAQVLSMLLLHGGADPACARRALSAAVQCAECRSSEARQAARVLWCAARDAAGGGPDQEEGDAEAPELRGARGDHAAWLATLPAEFESFRELLPWCSWLSDTGERPHHPPQPPATPPGGPPPEPTPPPPAPATPRSRSEADGAAGLQGSAAAQQSLPAPHAAAEGGAETAPAGAEGGPHPGAAEPPGGPGDGDPARQRCLEWLAAQEEQEGGFDPVLSPPLLHQPAPQPPPQPPLQPPPHAAPQPPPQPAPPRAADAAGAAAALVALAAAALRRPPRPAAPRRPSAAAAAARAHRQRQQQQGRDAGAPAAGGAHLQQWQCELAATLRRPIGGEAALHEVAGALRRSRQLLRNCAACSAALGVAPGAVVQALLQETAACTGDFGKMGGTSSVPMHQAKVLDRAERLREAGLSQEAVAGQLRAQGAELSEEVRTLESMRELLRIKVEDDADVRMARAFAEQSVKLLDQLELAPGGLWGAWQRLERGEAPSDPPPPAGPPPPSTPEPPPRPAPAASPPGSAPARAAAAEGPPPAAPPRPGAPARPSPAAQGAAGCGPAGAEADRLRLLRRRRRHSDPAPPPPGHGAAEAGGGPDEGRGAEAAEEATQKGGGAPPSEHDSPAAPLPPLQRVPLAAARLAAAAAAAAQVAPGLQRRSSAPAVTAEAPRPAAPGPARTVPITRSASANQLRPFATQQARLPPRKLPPAPARPLKKDPEEEPPAWETALRSGIQRSQRPAPLKAGSGARRVPLPPAGEALPWLRTQRKQQQQPRHADANAAPAPASVAAP